MIWFTADLHLGHEAIIRMQKRPFENVQDMNRILIANINACVQPQDKLYILGDVSHHISPEETDVLIRKIHGRKFLILGNHDVVGNPAVCPYNLSLFEWTADYRKISEQGVTLILMHYPLLSWEKARSGSVMLHGHIHSDHTYNENNILHGIRRFDVGADANHYFPVSLETIRNWAEEAGKHPYTPGEQYLPGPGSGIQQKKD